MITESLAYIYIYTYIHSLLFGGILVRYSLADAVEGAWLAGQACRGVKHFLAVDASHSPVQEHRCCCAF